MSLDMASGVWAIQRTERAKLISAFVYQIGHFQWIRMLFGLKNAPLVSGVSEVDVPDPEPMTENPHDKGGFRLPVLMNESTLFRSNIPTPTQMGPVLGRSTYIDDIAHGEPTWNQLCEDLNALLLRPRHWNISVSLPKSKFGKPAIAKSVQDLTFPSSLKPIRSFLRRLYHYNKFMEDQPVVAATIYDMDDWVRFERYLDKAKPFDIIPHANPRGVCAVLGQEREGIIQQVLPIYLKKLKDYYWGDLVNYMRKEVKKIAKGSDRYVLDSSDVLYRLAMPTLEGPRDKCSELRQVVPEVFATRHPTSRSRRFPEWPPMHYQNVLAFPLSVFWIEIFENAEMFVKG
ncbi:reverse transcriptase [Phytophthora megakarya]|uniref:Reverse transcriptase n=1 Tax=Phytophthora megakarya TaxID=4795 RepID=A0A225W6Y0_9STRA|nr:reverse transcriptase [Phytophthora megakarya]